MTAEQFVNEHFDFLNGNIAFDDEMKEIMDLIEEAIDLEPLQETKMVDMGLSFNELKLLPSKNTERANAIMKDRMKCPNAPKLLPRETPKKKIDLLKI